MAAILGHCGETRARCVHIGLINNMPDAALARTERQFRALLARAAPAVAVQLSLFSLPRIARSEAGLRHLETNCYRSTDTVADARLDAYVVTGTEPRQSHLEDEPYWHAMTGLFDTLERWRSAVIFSCLAAHAAAFHFDGLRRHRLPQKRFGVFAHTRAGRHELTAGMNPLVHVAHSRCNEISADALEQGGYQVLTLSPEAGADLFVKRGRENWLFCQGHPEYDAEALGREFQRDVRRFLKGERDTYPALPQNYFGNADTEELMRFERRAHHARAEATMLEFPFATGSRPPAECEASTVDSVFGRWLQNIAREKVTSNTQFNAPVGDTSRRVPGLTASARRRRLAQLAMLQG
jgi:homoserine O-succinyltransferase